MDSLFEHLPEPGNKAADATGSGLGHDSDRQPDPDFGSLARPGLQGGAAAVSGGDRLHDRQAEAAAAAALCGCLAPGATVTRVAGGWRGRCTAPAARGLGGRARYAVVQVNAGRAGAVLVGVGQQPCAVVASAIQIGGGAGASAIPVRLAVESSSARRRSERQRAVALIRADVSGPAIPAAAPTAAPAPAFLSVAMPRD